MKDYEINLPGHLWIRTLPVKHRTRRGDMFPMERSLVEQVRDGQYWATVYPKQVVGPMAGVTYGPSQGTVAKYIEAHQWELYLQHTREQIAHEFGRDKL